MFVVVVVVSFVVVCFVCFHLKFVLTSFFVFSPFVPLIALT